MLYGVDVHDGYQHGLDFATIKRQGYTFAAVKLTQGTGYERDMGDDWVRAVRAAGLIPGGYHWITRADGAAQARWFHAKVVQCGGPEGMLAQLDCEDDATLADIRAFNAEWQRLTGGHPLLIYTGGWWWRPRGWDGASLTPWLWDSHYLTADTDTIPDDPAAFAARIPANWWTPGYGNWPAATFVQFTSRGDAGTLANNVDLSATRLTMQQLLALTTNGGGDVIVSDADAQYLIWRVEAIIKDLAVVRGGPAKGEENVLHDRLDRIDAELAELKALVTTLGVEHTHAVNVTVAGTGTGGTGPAQPLDA